MRTESLQLENGMHRNGAGAKPTHEPDHAQPELVERVLSLDGLNTAVPVQAVIRTHGRIHVVGQGQTAADVFDAVGGPQFNLFTNLDFIGIRDTQAQMIETIIQGTSDVGVTKDEVPMDLLKSGLTVFSPLEMRSGVPVRPEKPITLITRVKDSR